MKKIMAALAVVAALAPTSCSKEKYDIYSTIAGTVVDVDTREPIGGATVTVSPGGLNTYTGDDGQFEFKDVEAQQYTVTVQKTGYTANRKSVNAPAGETARVSLTMQSNE